MPLKEIEENIVGDGEPLLTVKKQESKCEKRNGNILELISLLSKY